MKTMLSRNGLAAAIEQVITLPIRGAACSIEPGKGDKGEAEFVNSVIMTPDEDGGMETPVSEMVGQITSGQVFRRAFFERVYKVRPSDEKIIYSKVAYRPPATCQARYNDRSGESNGFRQQVWLFGGNLQLNNKQKVPGYVDIPKIRSYIYTHGKYREPLTGVSELDVSYWALAHGTLVQTPDGPVPIEELTPGDLVFGANGMTRVTAVHPRGERPMFRVTLRDGTSALCDAEHLWGVHDAQRSGRYRVVSTQEMMDGGLLRGTAMKLWRYKIPACRPVEYAERLLPIDPYTLGAWLGDGSMQRTPGGEKLRTSSARIAVDAYGNWVAEEIARRLPSDMKLVRSGHDYLFVPVVARDTNPFRDALVGLGVNQTSGDKFIPEIYLQGSVKQRLDLLRGLMDTDGSVTGKVRTASATGLQVRFYTTSQRMVDDIRRLVRSLGGTATRGGTPSRKTMWVDIFTDECPFLLPPKAAIWEEGGGGRRQSNGNTIVSIEAAGSSMCRCITVAAGDGLFLVNDFMTTHNCYQLANTIEIALPFNGLWFQFLEGMALQRLIVYGNDQAEATARADDISQLRGSGVVGLVHPIEGQKAFEAIPSAGDAGAFFSAAMTFLENWMTCSVLAGFLQLTGAAVRGRSSGGSSSSGGSNAMSKDQSAFFLQSRTAIATEMADSISHDLIRPLVVLNFGASAAFPKWKFGPLQDNDSEALLTLFGTLAAAPVLHIPMPVFDLICERMAKILDLDVDQVHAALVSTSSQRAEQLAANPPPGMPPEAAAGLGQLQGLAHAATGITQQAMARPGGAPGLRPPPPAPGPRMPPAGPQGVPQGPAGGTGQ